MTQVILQEVLDRAIKKEIESQRLYSNLSEKVMDKAAKDAFQFLVRQERQHQNLLEQYSWGELTEGALSRGGLVLVVENTFSPASRERVWVHIDGRL